MATPRIADSVGRVLGGRYRLTRRLGQGAFAQVYVADDVTLRRRVAIKVLNPALADERAFLRRFTAEAQAVASLRHPHILRVYDWGEDDGDPYLVMELLEGGSLRSFLDQGRRLSPAQAARVGADVAGALDYAQRRGLIHRDVKPANLIFDDEGRIALADFGLARALAEATLTEPTGTVVGTARYAAPEQIHGESLDQRADVYALALVLVEATTGQVPFAVDTSLATLMRRLRDPITVDADLGPLGEVLEAAGTVAASDRLDAAQLTARLEEVAATLAPPARLVLAGPLLSGAVEIDHQPTEIPGRPGLFDIEAVETAAKGRAATGGRSAAPRADAPADAPMRPSPGWTPIAAPPAPPGGPPKAPVGSPQPASPRRGSWDTPGSGRRSWRDAAIEESERLPPSRSRSAAGFGPAGRPGPGHGSAEAGSDLDDATLSFDVSRDLDRGHHLELEDLAADDLAADDLAADDLAADDFASEDLALGGGAEYLPAEDVERRGFDGDRSGRAGQSGPPAEPKVRRHRRGRRVILALVVVVILAAAAVAGYVVTRPAPTYAVPSLRGDTIPNARAAVRRAHLRLIVASRAYNPTAPAGTVLTQQPSGVRLTSGRAVHVVVSKGPHPIPVPAVTGHTLADARSAISAAGLAVGKVDRTTSLTVPAGSVISSAPSGGTLLPHQRIALVVSTGKPTVAVPTLSGASVASYDAASAALKAIGLPTTESSEYSNTVPSGEVIITDPAPGAVVTVGTSVNVSVSKGPDLVVVPDVSGDSVTGAAEALNGDGFHVSSVNGSPLGTVTATSPGSGTSVLYGSSITLTTG